MTPLSVPWLLLALTTLLPCACAWRVVWLYENPSIVNETRVYDDKSVIAMETVPFSAETRLLEATNGEYYLKIATSSDGHIVDCDVTNVGHHVADLTKRFFGHANSFLGELMQEEINMEDEESAKEDGQEMIHTDPLPVHYSSMVDLDQLERSCLYYRTTQRMTASSTSQNPLTNPRTTLLPTLQRHLASTSKAPPLASSSEAELPLASTSATEPPLKAGREVVDLRSMLFMGGTKWCGPGNMAASYTDLGAEREADMCCRDHDHCPDQLSAGATRWSLTHTGIATWSHCHCDRALYDCLKAVGNSAANNVGFYYFNLFKVPCFEFREKRDCAEYGSDSTSCTQYGEVTKEAYLSKTQHY